MARSRSYVLTYHSLDRSGSVVSTDPSVFVEQMDILADSGIPVVPLEEIRERRGAVALTFDDAFGNVAEIALPLLERHRFPATIFAVSGYTGRRNDWPSQASGIPLLPLMTWHDLVDASRRGYSIGAHTVTHPRLSGLSPDDADHEMEWSASSIADHIGIRPTSFAYPYGDAPPHVRDFAAQRFFNSCTTVLAPVGEHTETFAISRIDTFYLRSSFWFERLFKPSGCSYLAYRGLLRSVRGALGSRRRVAEARKWQFEQ